MAEWWNRNERFTTRDGTSHTDANPKKIEPFNRGEKFFLVFKHHEEHNGKLKAVVSWFNHQRRGSRSTQLGDIT